jgi:hypothetical protein
MTEAVEVRRANSLDGVIHPIFTDDSGAQQVIDRDGLTRLQGLARDCSLDGTLASPLGSDFIDSAAVPCYPAGTHARSH